MSEKIEEITQLGLPNNMGKDTVVSRTVREIFTPPEKAPIIYKCKIGTAMNWQFRSFYGEATEEFYVIKLIGRKNYGLQAWKIVDGVKIKRITEKKYGEAGYIRAGHIIGMYANEGDFIPIKSKKKLSDFTQNS